MNLSGADPGRTKPPGPRPPWLRVRGRDAHTLAGAYAMDAISAPDRARFERHLARCEECAQEIASLREATARLGSAAAVRPPAGLKDRVMAAAAMTRQQPPAAAEADSTARARAAGRWFRSLAWPGRLAVAAAAAAAVVALVAAVVFGVANGSMRQQLDQAQTSSQQVAAVLTARDARMMTGPVTGGGTATIVMSHAKDALVFSAAGLRALPASRGYELWLIGPTGDRPVGMLSVGSRGMTGPVIASGLRRGDHLALTAEPASGTSQPTAPMMLDVAL
jgi:anti-sigma-K factor RskA